MRDATSLETRRARAIRRPTGTQPGIRSLTTFYNGACPVCGFEIRRYREISRRRSLDLVWCDISKDPRALARFGVREADAAKRLYVEGRDGTLHDGVDAFATLWDELPGFRWLAMLVRRPPVRPVALFVYDRILAPTLFALNARRNRMKAT